MKLTIEIEGERFDVEVQRGPDGVKVECEEVVLDLKGHPLHAEVDLESGGDRWRVRLESDDLAQVNGHPVEYHVAEFQPGSGVAGAGQHKRVPVRAVMHGRLVKVLTEAGKAVQKGEPLFVLEAMKMQNELSSPSDGTIVELVAKSGDVVDVGRVLAWLER